ncbi:COPII coat assembly protein sec-16 [Moelleriella libera RCEF 2490]|uniref:Protein transport protein sec16 n=1 Tax=Moelleriella libera RCEF 2490 TaxID=1081109 RepID=A0A168CF68_9HYPO|nr:COPII coat assembly protein sec-16 [Moelleriella libera RCEF 2490]
MVDEPSSSWHPALMPNSAADITAQAAESKQSAASKPVDTAPNIDSQDDADAWLNGEDESLGDAWIASDGMAQPETDQQNSQLPPMFPVEDAQSAFIPLTNGSHDHAETSSDVGNEGDAGPLLLQDNAAHLSQEHESVELPHQTDRALIDETVAGNDLMEPLTMDTDTTKLETEFPSPQGTQHSRSMSFTRTVSHEVNFNDDEEADWNLGRADEDPFAFMPPSERANSFPTVPPTTTTRSASEMVGAQPLPSSQALGVMTEDAKEAQTEAQEYLRSPELDSSEPWETPSRIQNVEYHSMGGEVEDFAASAQEARFEEGLPLIPRAEIAEGNVPPSMEPPSDPFAEEDEKEDDFFAGVMTKQTVDDPKEPLETIERKSTFQVLGDFGGDDAYGQSNHLNDSMYGQADEGANGLSSSEGFPEGPVEPELEQKDLKSKWDEAFGDDDEDDFLIDDSSVAKQAVDEAGFLGSDDEGLLDDDGQEDINGPATGHPAQRAASAYIPAALPQQETPYSPSLPSAPLTTPLAYTQQPVRQETSRAQSFADKSKDGYASPYDLPTDLVKSVKPRKRPSLQQLPAEPVPPPPRSATMQPPGYSQAPLLASTSPSAPPPIAGPASQSSSAVPTLRSKSSFFEELPMSSRPRPVSRQSQRAPSPGQYAPVSPAMHVPPPPLPPPPPAQTVPPPTTQAVPRPFPTARTASAPQRLSEDSRPMPGLSDLVAPPKTSPYAANQAHSASATIPSSNSSRYSPAPPDQQGGGGSAVSRYSPAPSVTSRPSSSYSAAPSHNVLSHLPRTSSPLAHFETSSNLDSQHHDRRASSSMEPRLSRVASLPPTREVDEEEEQVMSPSGRSFSANVVPTRPNKTQGDVRYSAASQDASARNFSQGSFDRSGQAFAPPASSRTKSQYAPQEQAYSAAPPPPPAQPFRTQTQSPSATYSSPRRLSNSGDSQIRTAPSHGPTTAARPRGQSISMAMAPPTNGTEHDPLERWRGAPVFAWGVGGTFVTAFPKSTPRYAMGQSTPIMIRTVGEVKVQNVKDLSPLQERLAKFPGPLKGKAKKKEVISWLAAGIETLEKDVPDISFHSQLSLDAKRSVERILLWKLLRIFIEHDGALEGNPSVEAAVRALLAPEVNEVPREATPLFTGATGIGEATMVQADGNDLSSVEMMRLNLLQGDCEKAIWSAVDKRLWGHAMLLSQTVAPNLYKQVADEFIRKEVNYPGHQNESLAALYKVLSGNYEDCVDELVPSHARAGMQLISTETSSGSTKDAMDGLDKWQETLTLVLSNRSNEDVRGLRALGKLLSDYGRAEAAHICFIFSRSQATFGGLHDSTADFVLVGSDHTRQPDQFGKETEALQLSEIYEYGLSLGGGGAVTSGAAHLSAYKLQHAMTLAEYGFRDKALQYCENIASSIVAQTRRSPYHHPIVEASVEDLLTRLKQAPKEASTSWISKPSVGKVSDSMWNRFNKFVSGDEDGQGHNGLEGDIGPFARIAPSPNISRTPSMTTLDTYGASAGYTAAMTPAQPSAAVSRYAPASTTSLAGPGANPYAPAAQAYPGVAMSSGTVEPQYAPRPYEPSTSASSLPTPSLSAPNMPATQSEGYHPSAYPGVETPSYQPIASTPAAVVGETSFAAQDDSQQQAGNSHYEPPSYQPYGYEPPSYQPYDQDQPEDESKPKPKKKSFMDDDDDDIPALKKPVDHSKAEKDRENEEMFRKAAEEDAKRAASTAAGAKKSWGFGGWFGGAKKAEGNIGEAVPGKPIKAKLGEQSSFVYDPELKRWINKKPGAENVEAPKATPPPPRAAPRTMSDLPPLANTPPPPMSGRSSVPPMGLPPRADLGGNLPSAHSSDNLTAQMPPIGLPRSVSSGSVPPSRPTTSMSNASSIDDLLGAPAPRKAGQKKPRKSGRYVDVMAK